MRAGRPSRDGRTASFADSLYPQDGQHLPYFELNPAVRRTARAGRLPLGRPATFASSLRAPGRPTPPKQYPIYRLKCRERPVAHSPERLRRWATRPAVRRTTRAQPTVQPNLHTLTSRIRPVAHPPEAATRLGRRGRRPKGRKNNNTFTVPECRIRPRPISSSPPAVSATSPDELQPAAWGGGELRDPMGRRSSPQFSAPCPPHCGSAAAPPVPLGTRKMGVRRNFRTRSSFSARLRDSFYFGSRRNS